MAQSARKLKEAGQEPGKSLEWCVSVRRKRERTAGGLYRIVISLHPKLEIVNLLPVSLDYRIVDADGAEVVLPETGWVENNPASILFFDGENRFR